MLEIFLVRHGATTLPNRYIGSTEVELAEEGRREVLRLKRKIQGYEFDSIYCSPLKRCIQTFELLGLQAQAIFDKRLREIDFGAWEKKTFEEICRHYPDRVESWSRYEPSFSFPGGENLASFQKRIVSFAASMESDTGGRILVISHGGVIRHLLCAFLGLPFENYLLFNIECGKITTLKLYDQGAVLNGLNKGMDVWEE